MIANAMQHTLALPAAREMASVFEPAKAPWISPGVVVHEPSAHVDALLGEFAQQVRARGFSVAGYVRVNTPGEGDADPVSMDVVDLSSGQTITIDREGGTADLTSMSAAGSLRRAMRDDVDLVVISHFPAVQRAARRLMASVDDGASKGMPVLTAITGHRIHEWLDFAGQDGAMISPSMKALWQWWGPERLYQDLALGVPDDEIRQIALGSRWVMIEGPHGAGLAYLPRFPKELQPHLAQYRRQSLRQLAQLSRSWDPVEMALGIAAINAHYNRFDIVGEAGNGAHLFKNEAGRVVVVGAFPGLGAVLPHCSVIETEPRPGEYPTVAMDTLVPGASAVVVNSSTVINRSLPRILRLAKSARVALVGPTTPMTARLHDYGVEVLGGLVVHDPVGLGQAIKAGALPKEFSRFGNFVHIRSDHTTPKRQCRFRPASA